MALQHLKTAGFDAAMEKADLAMVDFWAEWCGPCRMLGPTIEGLAAKYDGRALVAKVNVEEEPELARRFGVSNIPTVVFLKNGLEIDRLVGLMASDAYQAVLERNL